MSTWDDKPNDYDHALVVIDRLRSRLEQIATVCADNDIDTADHRMALRFVRDVATKGKQ
jgi:hypothetical protein